MNKVEEMKIREISNAIYELNETVRGKDEAKNMVSKEIRKTEAALMQFGISEEFEYPIGTQRDEHGEYEGIIAWSKNNKEGRFRLMHAGISKNVTGYQRPLIECPFSIREKCIFHLTGFIRSIQKNINQA